MKRILCLCLLFLVTILLLTGSACAGKKRADVDHLVFALDWTPNTNHSGLFLARDRGFYAEVGMDVEFRESDMDFIEMVAGGSATFGMAAQEQVILARSASVPVVAIAAVVQHNSSGFASPLDRGIRTASDFEGRTYSGWGTSLELEILRTLMEKEGADFNRVRVINQSAGNFIASMELEADFAWIYYGWDGVNCELAGYPIHFIPLREMDPDLDFYSPVLISNEETVKKNPDLVRRFLRATARGYLLAIEDPEQAVESLAKEAPGLDRKLLAASQSYLNSRYIDDAPFWGAMNKETWQRFSDWMIRRNLIEGPFDVDAAYVTSFLPEDAR